MANNTYANEAALLREAVRQGPPVEHFRVLSFNAGDEGQLTPFLSDVGPLEIPLYGREDTGWKLVFD